MSKFHCCVPHCTNDARYDAALSFHRFPSSDNLRKQWIAFADARYDAALSFHRFPSSDNLRKQWIAKTRRDEG